MICYLDTQVVVWLCQGQVERFSAKAVEQIERADVLISPIVLLELEYLFEIKRVTQPPQHLLSKLQAEIGLRVCEHPYPAVVHSALGESWTRDPFDRLIVAHARANGNSPLISSDEAIQRNYWKAVW